MPLENAENPTNAKQSAPSADTKPKDHQDKSEPPVAPKVAVPDPPSPPHKHCEITANIKRDRIDWWTLRLEGLGLGVLVVYTIFTALMYCANKKSADAAKNASDTAHDSLIFTQSEFRMDQRPYLSAVARAAFAKPTTTGIDTGQVPFSYTTKSKQMAFFSAAVDLRNIGKSPARNVVHTRTDYIYAPRDYARKAAKTYRPEFNSAATIVAMGEFITPQTPDRILLTPVQARQLLDGTWEIYVVGAVQYTDIFSPAIPPYETDYCFKIRISGMPYANCEWQAPDFTSSIK